MSVYRKFSLILFIVLGGWAWPLTSGAMMICDDEAALRQKADLVVVGEVRQTTAARSSGPLSWQLAVLKVEKVLHGAADGAEIVVEFRSLEPTLEADVQDAQLDTVGERATAYLEKLPNGHYRIMGGICGWKFISLAGQP